MEHNSKRPSHEDCVAYALPDEWYPFAIQRVLISAPIEKRPGAVAIYFGKERKVVHLGRVTANGNTISKWQTKGHVYEHKPNLVPSIYGDISNIEYYNPPK